ncbi:nuclear pore complex protein Nup50 isoform X2 [Microcaecilia unicolor]|nr:nuclear pore complex protein Nup50 isoform X2 [Microcaecilia unicolor]XP_030070552.1 nuclear pore complex protein Nup50 isoform X2 [Microcaecilia unicolor]XP_030070553.1 nuclear pore complex protein Nup50 isoform X2 [Microcaecilia unicolor]
MAKRMAEKELTDRNWDQEEDTEEAGRFSVASEDILKNRAIKKAKRRNVGQEAESGGAFKGFKGLILPTGSGFGFGSGSGSKPLEGLVNGTSSTSSPLFTNIKSTSETKPALGSLAANGPTSTLVDKHAGSAKTNGEMQQPTSSVSFRSKTFSSSDYNKQLTSLNNSVRDWIVKHVNLNPLCDLTPIFRDYEKHLTSIEQKYGSSTDSGSESDGNSKTIQTQSALTFGSSKLQKGSTFSFNKNPVNTSDKMEPSLEKKIELPLRSESNISFNFGQKIDSPVLSSLGSDVQPNFSFSSGNSGLFSKEVNQSKPVTSFSFDAKKTQSESGSDDKGIDGDEESEEPPKVVVNEVKEEDAFFSKKCKLFYKKDQEFKEKGVGMLHLKPVGNKKTQLLVRADTNLGNILLNVFVQPSMPCSRTGKNNVIIVCVPNPPVDEKNPDDPVTMLIRVKTSEDANELHKILLEKKEVSQ